MQNEMVAKSHFIAYFRVKICKTIRSALNSVPRFLLRVLVRTEMTNLYIYIIYIYIYMLIVIFYDLPFSRGSFNIKKLSNSFRS